MSKLKNSKDYLCVLLWTSSWWQWPGTALTSVNWAHSAHPSGGQTAGARNWARIYVVWLSATQHEAMKQEGAGSCKYAICPAKCRSTKSREFLLKTVSIWWAHHATVTADSSIREPVKLDWQTVVASDSGSGVPAVLTMHSSGPELHYWLREQLGALTPPEIQWGVGARQRLYIVTCHIVEDRTVVTRSTHAATQISNLTSVYGREMWSHFKIHSV